MGLIIEKNPAKTAYRPGEEVSFEGISLSCGGEDVTGRATFSLEPGYTWKAADRKIDVTATYVDAAADHVAVFSLRRRRRILPFLLLLLAALAVAEGAVIAYELMRPPAAVEEARGALADDAGSYLIPQGSMTDEEAQALLDEITEKSKITVSIAPKMELRRDGALRVNFAVPAGNNGLAERCEVVQGGEVVWSSGVVRPGRMVEWTDAGTRAAPGPATATVYAVNPESSKDSGNPFSVEVEVVGE